MNKSFQNIQLGRPKYPLRKELEGMELTDNFKLEQGIRLIYRSAENFSTMKFDFQERTALLAVQTLSPISSSQNNLAGNGFQLDGKNHTISALLSADSNYNYAGSEQHANFYNPMLLLLGASYISELGFYTCAGYSINSLASSMNLVFAQIK